MRPATNLLRKVKGLLDPYLQERRFPGSQSYWERRYEQGGNSGDGSYGILAEFKAEVLNNFIAENGINSVIEFGCGDGHQLGLLHCERYTGIDVSPTAIQTCTTKYGSDPTKYFLLAAPGTRYPSAAMAMSLDVIYHLVEDDVFETYMETLFASAERFVVIYSSNGNPVWPKGFSKPPHVRHRRFTDWVNQNARDWKLLRKLPNRYPLAYDSAGNEQGSFADFYFFGKAH